MCINFIPIPRVFEEWRGYHTKCKDVGHLTGKAPSSATATVREGIHCNRNPTCNNFPLNTRKMWFYFLVISKLALRISQQKLSLRKLVEVVKQYLELRKRKQ